MCFKSSFSLRSGATLLYQDKILPPHNPCTGFNNVDLDAAERLGLIVMRVMKYSSHAVAEFAVGLILTLNRKFHKAYNRVREENFLLDGLLGFDMFRKTVGIIGTGKIGTVTGRILAQGFGCHILTYDVYENPAVQRTGADLGIGFDGDADRCEIVDEKDRTVPNDLITAFLTKNSLSG